MHAVFVELAGFARNRAAHLDDAGFRELQQWLMREPERGDLIVGTGGLRKVRFADEGRQRGKRGGLRLIYYWWPDGAQFWLFTVYGKGIQDDLDPAQRQLLSRLLDEERKARSPR